MAKTFQLNIQKSQIMAKWLVIGEAGRAKISVNLYKNPHERAGIFFVSISIMIPHHIPHGTWGEFGTARADCYGLKMHFHDNFFFPGARIVPPNSSKNES
jgi:hypothetical protein